MSWLKSNNPPPAAKETAIEPRYAMPRHRPLPVGIPEFHEWAERIIDGAGLPATADSQKYTLAHMLTNLPPEKASESDDYFINALRRAAANQVAIYYREKIYPEVKARLAMEEKEAADKAQQNTGDATPPTSEDAKVLDLRSVQSPTS